MSLPMVKIEGVPDADAIRPGMAFFCGTGPAGTTCGDCQHRGYRRESRSGKWSDELQQQIFRSYSVLKCAIFNKMTARHGADVAAKNPSCKYFQQKPKT